MKKILKYLLIIFVALNLLILISGKSWMYKAISITYLKGYPSSYIHDFVHFPANTIKAGTHQEWGISKEYNKASLPDFNKPINETLETVAFMVIVNDSQGSVMKAWKLFNGTNNICGSHENNCRS